MEQKNLPPNVNNPNELSQWVQILEQQQLKYVQLKKEYVKLQAKDEKICEINKEKDEKLCELNGELVELRKKDETKNVNEINKLKIEIEKERLANQEKDNQIKSMLSELKNLREENHNLIAENDRLKYEFNSKLQKAFEQIQVAKKSAEQSNLIYEESRKQIDLANKEIAQLKLSLKNSHEVNEIANNEIMHLKSELEKLSGQSEELDMDIPQDANENSSRLENEAKKYKCPDCNNYQSDVRANVNAHKKNNCPATKHLRMNDHQCPICLKAFTYEKLRMHLYQYVGPTEETAKLKIKSARSRHSTTEYGSHCEIYDKLLNAYDAAAKNGVEYTPFYPLNI